MVCTEYRIVGSNGLMLKNTTKIHNHNNLIQWFSKENPRDKRGNKKSSI
jgi:hypothetical protein